jgi:hypothetical protein
VIFSGSTKWKRYQGAFMEEIEKIPPHNTGTLTMEYYSVIKPWYLFHLVEPLKITKQIIKYQKMSRIYEVLHTVKTIVFSSDTANTL